MVWIGKIFFEINLALGKDPPILGAETLQRLTAEKSDNKQRHAQDNKQVNT